MPDDPNDKAVPFSEVLAAELDQIAVARGARGVATQMSPEEDASQRARHSGLLGLAFSGGGIRSATFNLGVLQALAGQRLLTELDYLSTVSGGGYIGSWFISLLRADGREKQVQEVQKTLSPKTSSDPNQPSQRPIHFLRQYSNYLTPHFSILSADVWTMAVVWLRNFLLNLLQLAASIGLLILTPRLIGMLFNLCPSNTLWDVVPSLILLSWVTFAICVALSRRRGWNDGTVARLVALVSRAEKRKALQPYCHRAISWLRSEPRGWTQARVQKTITVELVLATLLLAHWLRATPQDLSGSFGFWCVFIYLSVSFLAITLSVRPKGSRLIRFVVLLFASLVPALVSSLIIWKTASLLGAHQDEMQYPWAMLTWAPPLIMVALALGVIIQIGMMGRSLEGGAREWLSRLRAWTLIYSTGWLLVFSASIYGPLWVAKLFISHFWTALGLSGGWVATTLGGVFSGKSALITGTPNSSSTSSMPSSGSSTLEWVARIGPFVFIAGFVLALSFAIHAIAIQGLYAPHLSDHSTPDDKTTIVYAPPGAKVSITPASPAPAKTWLSEMPAQYFCLLWCASTNLFGQHSPSFISGGASLFVVLLVIGLLLSFRLDINIFSLHEFYKNRLVRCYLGAVRNDGRRPDEFTGFDDADDQPLSSFTTNAGGHYYGPYPILNATLNLSSGGSLAWQERKSAPYIFTPRFCGFDVEGENEAMRIGEGFDRPSQDGDTSGYAYRPTTALCPPEGINLGTAVSVSGAAANPNQGYHTSTAVAFLMTVFDVRLGWWIGNPYHRKGYRESSPLFNLGPLTNELFGLSDARSRYVNLSDGGHFDNMGLYELIRRHCRYIILSDAEEDGKLTFGSLTTTIRNCRTDFGVEISISLDRIAKNAAGFSPTHCVVGDIKYPGDDQPAYLLYLKSSLTGDEPADVGGYHAGHAEFPHESTADQWFTEGQFEAYRKLGQHIAETALGGVRASAADRAAFFDELSDKLHPPSDRVDKFSAKHTDQLAALTLAIADEDRLSFIDRQILKGWDKGEEIQGRWERNAAYRCTAFIDFMLAVFTDLNLESSAEREHPHNKGWIEIFRHWVGQEIFQQTWGKTKENYSRRFQAFYEDLVNPPPDNQTENPAR